MDLFNANDGIRGRDGGPYLDDVEREHAELRRAKVEGREPNLENPPATAGIQLVHPSLLADNISSHPSRANVVVGAGVVDNYSEAVVPSPVATVPDKVEDTETKQDQGDLFDNDDE
jgi:hypothetical protein